MSQPMNKREFAERAGISVRKLEGMMKQREVSFIKHPGGSVRFLERHLEELFARYERPARQSSSLKRSSTAAAR